MQHENQTKPLFGVFPQVKASDINRPDFGAGIEKEVLDFESLELEDGGIDDWSSPLLPAVQRANGTSPDDDGMPALSFDADSGPVEQASLSGSLGSDSIEGDGSGLDRIESLRSTTLPHHDGLRLRMREDTPEAGFELSGVEFRSASGVGAGSVDVGEVPQFNDELWWMLRSSDPVQSGIATRMNTRGWQAETRITDSPVTDDVHASAYTATDDLWAWKVEEGEAILHHEAPDFADLP